MESKYKSLRAYSPSRLHFTLIDMQSSFSGRIYGGAGLAINEPGAIFSVSKNNSSNIVVNSNIQETDDLSELMSDLKITLNGVQENYDLGGIDINIERIVVPHRGFGSKSTTLLAAAATYCKLFDIDFNKKEIAKAAKRGGTSGIGVEAALSGGFIVDCGHPFKAKNYLFGNLKDTIPLDPAPIVCRFDFPNWPILIVIPNGRIIQGEEERRLVEEICPIPLSDVQSVSHITLMMLIPSIIEGDFSLFCNSINLIQSLKWKESEINAHKPVVGDLMEMLRGLGLEGVGMTSWGPAVFSFGTKLNNESEKNNILREVNSYLANTSGGECFVTYANNQGVQVEEIQD